MTRHKHSILKIFFPTILIAFLFIFAPNPASALSCDSNASTKKACNSYADDSSVSYGAMWLNSVSTGDGIESDKIVVEDASGTINLYIHGAVYHGSGSFYANSIHITTDNASGSPYQSFNDEPSITFGSDRQLYRGTGSSDNGWSTDWEDGYVSATLDIAKFKEGAAKCAGDDSCWEKTLYAYRCYGSSYNGQPGSCYADPIQLKIKEKSFTLETSSASNIPSSPVVYVGESTSSAKVATTITTSGDSPSTIADKLQYQSVYFVIPANVDATAPSLAARDLEINKNANVASAIAKSFGYDTWVYDFGTSKTLTQDLIVPDDAGFIGAKICLVQAANVASFTGSVSTFNAYLNGDTQTWRTSSASCRTIAKKPSVAVKDGSVYSENNITTSPLSIKSDGEIYGSWVEYLAIANQTIKNFSSGAAINALNTTDVSTLSPLTISNTDVSNLGNAKIAASDSFVKRTLSKFPTSTTTSNLEVIRVASGDIDITADYAIDGLFSDLSAIPQRIYISENGNINIASNVTRLDAWLIAPNGVVDTCAGISNPSSDQCTEPLVINGATYAKNLILDRTAGVTITPAETLDLLPTTYLWTSNQATQKTNSISTVSIRELAPRL